MCNNKWLLYTAFLLFTTIIWALVQIIIIKTSLVTVFLIFCGTFGISYASYSLEKYKKLVFIQLKQISQIKNDLENIMS